MIFIVFSLEYVSKVFCTLLINTLIYDRSYLGGFALKPTNNIGRFTCAAVPEDYRVLVHDFGRRGADSSVSEPGATKRKQSSSSNNKNNKNKNKNNNS